MAQFHLHLLASLLLLQLFLLQPFWKSLLLGGLAEGQAVRVATNLLLPFEPGISSLITEPPVGAERIQRGLNLPRPQDRRSPQKSSG